MSPFSLRTADRDASDGVGPEERPELKIIGAVPHAFFRYITVKGLLTSGAPKIIGCCHVFFELRAVLYSRLVVGIFSPSCIVCAAPCAMYRDVGGRQGRERCGKDWQTGRRRGEAS